jgi:putative phosphoesterase
MRIAVVSDIHGNWTALQAVIEDLKTVDADVVVQGGDLAGSGSRPAEVIDLVASLGWPGVFGNTDEALWRPQALADLAARNPTLSLLWEIVFNDIAIQREAIGKARIDWLRKLPREWRGPGVAVVHASPGDCWNAPASSADDAELEGVYAPLESPLVVYGHVHKPFVRQLSGFVVANSGSVSLPYDGDPRASYLLVEDGRPTIRRVAYDVEVEIRELAARHYPYVDWVASMLRTGSFQPPPAKG